ncbi:uncharacterized protein EV420DRAFT_1639003 [Desarmillaria tabescens]|uniref:Uncharacterized protein n=1 Tax=Armillaria tabescens TaxID=1929756 RepID=A0AA39TL30_ARMTA|nr:uncharacterized protein EV420DRAFT_1639003 [Desarmillaria tabescens]KAK0462912.1 hypothetical protein EV420DRAFT_1639003 [Desarmillaria tabescens]
MTNDDVVEDRGNASRWSGLAMGWTTAVRVRAAAGWIVGERRTKEATNSLYAIAPPAIPKSDRWCQQIPLPPSPSLSITLSQNLIGGSATVVAKFYDPLSLHDVYESVDLLRFAARSVASEAKAYEMLQSVQGICLSRCLGLCAAPILEPDGRTVLSSYWSSSPGKIYATHVKIEMGRRLSSTHLCDKLYSPCSST